MAKRIAVLDRTLCTRDICGYVCMNVCPVNRMGKECIIKEKSTGFPVISEDLCIGCGICPKKCPVFCIKIINLTKDLEEPVYQYGKNAFRLYSLPLPRGDLEGAISLVGKNGIGKTTALELLSGHLIPNFGDFEKKYTLAEVLDSGYFKPQFKDYFSSLKDKLKISVKPQYVAKLREVFKGKVSALLKKSIPKEKVKEAIEIFEMENILDREVEHLSGGELQKLAIAIAYSKDADIYYFDEVTNYLDIGERLRAAILLKEFSSKKPVLLVDHDLTILDYVSDYVYLFYGEESAYGIVSSLKSVRNGINEYLKGYLTTENMRIREYEITFSSKSEGETKSKTMFTYSALKKSFLGFKFSSDAGEIKEGEIIGIVGKNALGKSVFMKMLAGIEEPDEGEGASFTVSYKPQYLEAENIKVKDFLSGGKLNHSVLQNAIRELQLSPLMEKKMNKLSGGELQRVALAKAISIEAQVYLFDEPSAFLDIEQRFAFSRLLRHVISDSGKSVFVVDHDVIFLDFISNRIIPFEGESSIKGHALSPQPKKEGMNKFLKMVSITMRRDKDSNRPRINKPGSVLDREQREEGNFYY